MKTLVAKVITKQEKGDRTYTIFNREGVAIDSVTVMDAGQGAAQARDWAKAKGYRESSADWAIALWRKHGVK